MKTTIKVNNNEGIISSGDNAKNTVYRGSADIEWDRLKAELDKLKLSTDRPIKKFADEASDAADKKDKGKLRAVFTKWIPCIGTFIEASYYIMEIAAKLCR